MDAASFSDITLFSVGLNSGSLDVQVAGTNFEQSPNTYKLAIEVTDDENAASVSVITVHVQDVNEAPTLPDTHVYC